MKMVKNKISKAAIAFALIVILMLTVLLSGCDHIGTQAARYEEAISLIESGKYTSAYNIFKELGDYKDSEAYLSRFHYVIVDASVTFQSEEDWSKTILKFTYNDKNLPSRISSYSTDSSYYTDYTYDDRGNLVKEHYGNGEYQRSVDYLYDTNGNLIKEIETVMGKSQVLKEYTYDENNRMITQSRPNYGILTEYSYDQNGKLIKQIEKNGDSEDSWYSTDYFYDEGGNLIRTLRVDGNHQTRTDYVYDENGKLIKETFTDGDIVNYVMDMTYDENGNLSKAVITQSWSIQTIEIKLYELVYIPYDLSDTVLDLIYPKF